MNLKEMKRLAKDQKDLDLYAKGYEIGSLSRLMGSDTVNCMTGVEELYEKMLAKLDSLARQVETSSAKVLEMVGFLGLIGINLKKLLVYMVAFYILNGGCIFLSYTNCRNWKMLVYIGFDAIGIWNFC